MSVPPPRKTNFCASKKKTIGDSSLKGRDPRSAFTSQAAQVRKNLVVSPLEKKKKSHKEGEQSSLKRSRRLGGSPRHLTGGIFRPEFHVSHKPKFHMSSSEHAIVGQLSEKNITNVVTNKEHWEAADVQAELAKEKKIYSDLCARLEALTATHKGVELALQHKALIAKLSKADNEIKALNDSIMIVHEEGFNKALRQESEIFERLNHWEMFETADLGLNC
ncbi:hypothetical protein LR48_Vigan10g126500 [Vigna angularis]|uniref:Uncharacterized protein n=1 Tax=Phaseolus angularis TaxID=3914 RepID=A0A0L9VK58_PHAAN|nr:hypothetical protein LR48_Vigan10g126500 [Vigna angularis]